MGGNSARVWRAIRPDKKHPCWREFVRPWIRLCFGSLRFASFAKVERRCSATSEDQTKASGLNPSGSITVTRCPLRSVRCGACVIEVYPVRG